MAVSMQIDSAEDRPGCYQKLNQIGYRFNKSNISLYNILIYNINVYTYINLWGSHYKSFQIG